jgi:hypothetical protein
LIKLMAILSLVFASKFKDIHSSWNVNVCWS